LSNRSLPVSRRGAELDSTGPSASAARRPRLPWMRAFLARARRAHGAMIAGTLMLLLAGASSPCAAQSDPQATEYQVKAAYLYKFIGYVEWPSRAQAASDAPLAIGVIGADGLADELQQVVAGRSIHGRAISVRKLGHGDPVAGLQMLFIGHTASDIAGLLAAARESAVLTVTESDDAFALGSVINFVVVQDKIRFDIALQSAEHAHLRISSRLLAVARKVV
jgi:hypothetical protein